MKLPAKPRIAAIAVGYLSTLRLPVLFSLTAAVFALDLVVPDVLPFIDEIVLGLGTAILGSWRRGRKSERGEPDGTGPPEA